MNAIAGPPGFPSVGKSSLLTLLTGTESEAAAYEFTTLTCIPGVIHYNDAKIQLLDLPGIIEGAAEGKGRGRQARVGGMCAQGAQTTAHAPQHSGLPACCLSQHQQLRQPIAAADLSHCLCRSLHGLPATMYAQTAAQTDAPHGHCAHHR